MLDNINLSKLDIRTLDDLSINIRCPYCMGLSSIDSIQIDETLLTVRSSCNNCDTHTDVDFKMFTLSYIGVEYGKRAKNG